MPIEIKELHIRINVDEGAAKGGRNAPAPASKAPDSSETVEEIMDIIRLQKER